MAWFLSFAAFQQHVTFGFFRGALLEPAPPIGKFRDTRYVHVRESDELDEEQMASWIGQAASIAGWDGGSPHTLQHGFGQWFTWSAFAPASRSAEVRRTAASQLANPDRVRIADEGGPGTGG